MSLPLTALLIGLSQQEAVGLSVGGPGGSQFGPSLQFGPPKEWGCQRKPATYTRYAGRVNADHHFIG